MNSGAGAGAFRGVRSSLLCWALAAGPALLARDAAALEVTPIELSFVGPSAVRVRVSQGSTTPCDSADDTPLIQGKFAPGERARATSSSACVCVQQTYEPFSDVDWGPASFACRAQICVWAGRFKRCRPAPDPTIRLVIHSQRGG